MPGDISTGGHVERTQRLSLLRNGLYNIGGATVRGAVGLLTVPLLIRLLGIREYGVWSLVYAVFALMTMSEAGISVAASVFLSKDLAKNDFGEAGRTLTFVLSSAAVLSAVLGLFLWIAGPFLVQPLAAFSGAERADAGRALQIAGFAVSIFILQRTLIGVEQAFDRYAAINALELCQSLLTSGGLVAVARLGGRTIDLMKWQVLTCVFLLAAHCWVVFRLLHGKGLSLQWSGSKARRIFRYNLATWTATMGSAAFGQCDRLIVGGILGPSLLGIYSAVTGMTSKINLFSATAAQPLVPSLSRDVALDAPSQGRIRQAMRLNALIAIEAGIFLYVLADWVMRVLVPGATARQDVVGLQIAAVIYALYSLNAPGFFMLFSLGGAWINAVVTLWSGLISLALILAGAKYFGLLGALAGNVGYLGTFLLSVAGLRKAGIALSRCLNWVFMPILGLAIALIIGSMLQGHLLWRSLFVIGQAGLFLFWLSHDYRKAPPMEFRLGRPSEEPAN
jgi:O-antigen/teichoic acid export membrane protein